MQVSIIRTHFGPDTKNKRTRKKMECTSAVWRLGIRVPVCGVSALASAVANVICSCTEALGLGCHHFPALQDYSIDRQSSSCCVTGREEQFPEITM